MPALSSRQQPAIRGAWVLSPRQPPVLAGALGRAVGLEPGSPSRLLRWPSGATAPSCARRSPCSLRSPASTRRRARTRRGAAIGWCRAAARCPTGCWAIARRGGVARMHRPLCATRASRSSLPGPSSSRHRRPAGPGPTDSGAGACMQRPGAGACMQRRLGQRTVAGKPTGEDCSSVAGVPEGADPSETNYATWSKLELSDQWAVAQLNRSRKLWHGRIYWQMLEGRRQGGLC